VLALGFGALRNDLSAIQATGNTERAAARGLSKRECEVRKRELKAVAEALGTSNEGGRIGSITCLP